MDDTTIELQYNANEYSFPICLIKKIPILSINLLQYVFFKFAIIINTGKHINCKKSIFECGYRNNSDSEVTKTISSTNEIRNLLLLFSKK